MSGSLTAIEQVAVAWQALYRISSLLPRVQLWTPWLILGGLQLAFLGAVWWFAHPGISWLTVPLLTTWGGEEILHYPEALLRLPDIYRRLDTTVGALLASVLAGAAVLLFASRFGGAPAGPRSALARAGRRFAALILAQLPLHLVVAALDLAWERWLTAKEPTPLRTTLYLIALFSGPVLPRALFFYVVPLVMLDGRGVARALADLPRTWSRGFWSALFLALVLALPLLPIRIMAGPGPTPGIEGNPEALGWIVLAEMVVGLAGWFLLAGSATLIYMSAVVEEDAWSGS